MAHRQVVQVRCTVQTSGIGSSPWAPFRLYSGYVAGGFSGSARWHTPWHIFGRPSEGSHPVSLPLTAAGGDWDDGRRGGHRDGPPHWAPEPSPAVDGSGRGRSRRGWHDRLGRGGAAALQNAGAAPDQGVPGGVSGAVGGGARG